ncbi:aspartyl protease family protein [Psychroserpens sp. SPM9]|uniref:aspartyl protease family protein n=1 Tax=Psychroserpens sp. SPM9 TaxID=2975598 RepID=UPI0021A52BF5|nr:aspartyl protease family protein [Psychroserpens sp. SPM9]MDG5492787.1 aspartyl protease family protein [Psychroserpens sp. SPM9]
MILYRKTYTIILLILLSCTFSFGQGQFNLSRKQTDKVRFQLINNQIILPVEINGVKLSFLLDTGVSKPILFNITNTDSLQINNVETIFLRGLGGGESVKALKSQNNFFKIGNAININQDIYVVFDQHINFTPKLGVPVHGIIGYDVFKNFVVEINYKSGYLKLHRQDSYKYKTCKKCETFNLSFFNNKPYIDVDVKLDEKLIPVKLLIDTGSSDALWLFENDSLGITTEYYNYFHDFLGRGLSGNVHGNRSVVKSVKLKSFELNAVNVAFPDSTSISFARKIKDRNGSLGAEVLRRFNLIVDYENSKITLKKNSNFKADFHYNRSGIVVEQLGLRVVKELASKNEILDSYGQASKDKVSINFSQSYQFKLKPAYTIVLIRENSVAEKAGLQVDDIIVSINGKEAHLLKLQDVISYFRNSPGKSIRLKIERNKQIMNFEFKLEDVFKQKELPN